MDCGWFYFVLFKTGSNCADQADLELTDLPASGNAGIKWEWLDII